MMIINAAAKVALNHEEIGRKTVENIKKLG